MFGQGFNSGFFKKPCFTDTTDIFKDNSGVALYTLDYDTSTSNEGTTTNTLQILGDTSCIATYKLNGDSTDLSGNYNGTDTNITYTTGYLGQSASFNGSSSFITLPGNMLNSLTAISASAWVYRRPGSSDSYEYILSGGVALSGQRYGIAVDDAGSGSVDNKFYITDGAASYHTNTTCNYNTWYHVVYTWSGTELKFYVNGALASTFSAVSCNFPSSGNGHKIGEYHHNGNYEWAGEIDQVRIFNKAISASEVTTLYNEIGDRNLTNSNVDFGFGGKTLYSAKFNGSNSYAYASSPVQQPTTNFSVSVWSKWDSKPSSSVGLVGNFKTGVTPQVGFAMTKLSNENVFSFWADGTANSSAARALGTTNFVTGQWYHTVGTYDGSNVKIYVNGVLEGTAAYTATPNATDQPLVIGRWYGNYDGYYHDGEIDQVRIFNKALSSTEISQLYGGGSGEIACGYKATTTDVNYPVTNAACYKLDNSAVDETGNYPGTESNIEYRFGRFGQAAVFNNNSAITTSFNIGRSNDYTISFWIKDVTDSNYGTYVDKWIMGVYNNDYVLVTYNKTSGKISHFVHDGTTLLGTLQTPVLDDNWHHIVCTQDVNVETKLYVDGVLQTSETVSHTSMTQRRSVAGGTGFYFGQNPSNSSTDLRFKGKIDQVRIFSSALDSAQVTKLYNEKPETDTSNFKTVLYKGDGGSQYISNVGFQPDLVWTKNRSEGYIHALYDSVRGVGNSSISNELSTDTNNTSAWHSPAYGYLSSFDANGFSLTQGSTNADAVNRNTNNYVAWVWKGSGFQPSQTFSNIKTQGLIAHWNATQSGSLYPGSTWYDLTSNNRDLTSVSNINIGNNNGGVINMGGTDQFYTPQFVNDQTFTIGGWFRRDALGSAGYENLWAQGYSPSIRLQIYGSGGASTGDRIYHYLHNGTTGNSYNTGIDAPKGAWFHIMVTYDFSNGTVKLYLNGSLAHTASTITGSIYSATNYDAYFRVAKNATNANGYINGAISQIRVYSDVLTDAEVLNDYNATKDLFQTNNQGTISATVDANQEAGFSIVKYEGNATVGATVGHGLGAKPEFILIKNLDATVNWIAYDTINNVIGYLDLTDSLTDGRRAWAVNNTDPTNTVVTFSNNQATNANQNYIMYCWRSVAGYSKIGSYEGNGTTATTTITTGFEPSWVMIKRIDSANEWRIFDTRRDTTPLNLILSADTHGAESNGGTTTSINITSTGFNMSTSQFGGSINTDGGQYLYMAFK